MSQLFSSRALKQRRSVGDRTGPISLLSPPLRATLGLGLLIAIGGGVWAILARIPISVSGTGVLLPVSAINSMLSSSNGVSIWMFDKPVEPWHAQALRFSERPESFKDVEMVDLAQSLLRADEYNSNQASFKSMADAYSSNLKTMYQGKAIKKGRLMLWVQSSAQEEQLSSALDQLQRTLLDTRAKSANILANQRTLQQELSSRTAYLASMKAIEAKGYVSRASILQEQAQVDNIRSQINNNRNQLIDIDNKRQQAYQQLRNQLAKVINDQLIFSPRDVYLSQVVPSNGEAVNQGDVVLEVSTDPLDGAALVPVFLASNEIAQVTPGMAVLATPAGYKRSEVGGIVGEVVAMAKVPSGLEHITARVGIKALAETIQNQEPSPTMAVVALRRAGDNGSRNSGGYQWSSRGVLPFAPKAGDRLDVEVTTRRVAPITLVLPALRSILGFAPPAQSADRTYGSDRERQP